MHFYCYTKSATGTIKEKEEKNTHIIVKPIYGLPFTQNLKNAQFNYKNGASMSKKKSLYTYIFTRSTYLYKRARVCAVFIFDNIIIIRCIHHVICISLIIIICIWIIYYYYNTVYRRTFAIVSLITLNNIRK